MMKKILLASALLLGVAAAQAVPAYRGLVQMKGADGQPMTVRIVGDERAAYYLAEDGAMLLPGEGGRLCYATLDAAGRAVPSKIAATAVRSAEAAGFVKAQDQTRILDAFCQGAKTAMRAPTSVPPTPTTASFNFPKTGHQKTLVLLVSFSDVPFRTANPYEHFNAMLNEEGYRGAYNGGSAHDYFVENSCGQFIPQFDLIGPIQLNQPESYYGEQTTFGTQVTHDARPWDMVIDACKAVDGEVDFSQYDANDDGIIDNVFVFYAGEGQATGGETWTIWPHAFNITQLNDRPNVVLDGKILGHYSCTNEWWGMTVGIGTFCHEFSHVLGLPDLYSTGSDKSNFTPGEWTILDQGPYNNYGFTPPYYTAWERFSLGWLVPEEINDTFNARLEPLQTNKAYLIPTSDPNEFFMLENRNQRGWDEFIPNNGMLIWHVKYNKDLWDNNEVNNYANQYVDLEEADNIQTRETMTGDCWPGSANKTSFTDDTEPSMRTMGGAKLYLPITDINVELNDDVTFKVAGGYDVPDAPENLRTTDINGTHFTLAWDPVDGVKNYILNVYTKDTNEAGYTTVKPVEGFLDRNVKKVTTFKVEDLALDTEYFATIRANTFDGVSAASPELAIRTLAEESGIVAVTGAFDASAEYYDLQGRRLSERPASGLVIERKDGRARLVRL